MFRYFWQKAKGADQRSAPYIFRRIKRQRSCGFQRGTIAQRQPQYMLSTPPTKTKRLMMRIPIYGSVISTKLAILRMYSLANSCKTPVQYTRIPCHLIVVIFSPNSLYFSKVLSLQILLLPVQCHDNEFLAKVTKTTACCSADGRCYRRSLSSDDCEV